MNIVISNAGDRPIYEQIAAQIKGAIMNGELKEGERLPSIRQLANDLRISVITTKRAYSDLEEQGFIRTETGKGSFVAGGNLELMREERLRSIEELLGRAVAEARLAGVSREQLAEMLELALEPAESGA